MTTPTFQEPGDTTPDESDDWAGASAEDLRQIEGFEPSEEAPYGYTTDRATGERRPKKRPGRPKREDPLPNGVTPTLDDLKARKVARSDDVAPITESGRKKRGRRDTRPEPEPLPPFRAGPIAKGMNGVYRRAGKLMKLWDPDVAYAVISCTYAEDEEDVTIGEAWENLAKTNPRIRAFLLKLLQGSAWGGLFMAHLPIFMALAMKEGIRERLPISGLMDAFLTDDNPYSGEQTPSGLSAMMGGIGPEDMAQMMNFAQTMMGGMAADVPRSQNGVRVPAPTGDDGA